jgi:thioredoxin-like negative regulator of GroEL
MLFQMRFVVILFWVGMGIAPQFSSAETLHNLAKRYAGQNDVQKADTQFSRALKNAAPEQVAEVASDYAAFLMNRGDYHKAELILRQAQTQLPHDKELKKLLARCLILQEKVMEGLRYLKSMYSETEAREVVAAIYREQGNRDMLAAVEQKWGLKRTEPFRSEPLHITSTGIPTLPRREVIPIPSQVQTSPPVLVPVASISRRTTVVPEEPVVTPSPLSLAASFPKLALVPKSSPFPITPSSPETTLALENLDLVNPIKLPGPPEVVPSTEKYPPRPPVAPRPPMYSEK